MDKIREALWNNYDKVNDEISKWEVASEAYSIMLDERDKLRNELIKLEQIEHDTIVKVSQIKSENKHEKLRNVIQIGTFIVSTCISLYAINKTFKFDQVSTVTSTLGRNILNGVVPKVFKR